MVHLYSWLKPQTSELGSCQLTEWQQPQKSKVRNWTADVISLIKTWNSLLYSRFKIRSSGSETRVRDSRRFTLYTSLLLGGTENRETNQKSIVRCPFSLRCPSSIEHRIKFLMIQKGGFLIKLRPQGFIKRAGFSKIFLDELYSGFWRQSAVSAVKYVILRQLYTTVFTIFKITVNRTYSLEYNIR